jgi:hypothetical protein
VFFVCCALLSMMFFTEYLPVLPFPGIFADVFGDNVVHNGAGFDNIIFKTQLAERMRLSERPAGSLPPFLMVKWIPFPQA